MSDIPINKGADVTIYDELEALEQDRDRWKALARELHEAVIDFMSYSTCTCDCNRKGCKLCVITNEANKALTAYTKLAGE